RQLRVAEDDVGEALELGLHRIARWRLREQIADQIAGIEDERRCAQAFNKFSPCAHSSVVPDQALGTRQKNTEALASVCVQCQCLMPCLSCLVPDPYWKAAPTIIFLILTHGAPCETLWPCVGWPFASPPRPNCCQDSLPEIASRLPQKSVVIAL